MAYSTPTEVREILKGLVGDGASGPEYDVTPSALSDGQIGDAIGNADSQIDLVLRKRGYSVPLPEPYPAIVKSLSKDIASYLSDLTFRGSSDYGGDGNPFRLRYDRAMDILNVILEKGLDLYNPGIDPDNPDSGRPYVPSVFNPYSGDVLLTRDVFQRGGPFGRDGAEYSETERYPGRGF